MATQQGETVQSDFIRVRLGTIEFEGSYKQFLAIMKWSGALQKEFGMKFGDSKR